MKKQERQQIYDKYGGKCAYCGCELPKRWHADHIEPIRRNSNGTSIHPERDVLENYNPSCPQCNRLKNSYSLEYFREVIQRYVNSLNSYSVQYQMAKKYGLVKETNTKVKFYFENENKT